MSRFVFMIFLIFSFDKITYRLGSEQVTKTLYNSFELN